jgi:hypothetical protein
VTIINLSCVPETAATCTTISSFLIICIQTASLTVTLRYMKFNQVCTGKLKQHIVMPKVFDCVLKELMLKKSNSLVTKNGVVTVFASQTSITNTTSVTVKTVNFTQNLWLKCLLLNPEIMGSIPT